MIGRRAGAVRPFIVIPALVGSALLGACRSDVPSISAAATAPAGVPLSGPISMALAGDISFQRSILDPDPGFKAVTDVMGGATLAFANLEVNLLDEGGARAAVTRPPPRWVFGAAAQARDLRSLGLDVVSLANNHATDFGADGLASTLRALDAVGLRHAGAGEDLAAAQAPVVAGRPGRQVALIAISASLAQETRASRSQPGIRGRAGANALGVAADVTVDAPTFATLKQSVVQLNAGPPPGEAEMTMFGTRIRMGDRTHVDFIVNGQDEEALLNAVRAARATADVVIVSMHSHEPQNASDRPADFARRVAHRLVDAGAQVVVGHGPHQIRGIEVYNGAAILYSLGNFVYQPEGLDFRAADAFDAGRDLLAAMLGASTQTVSPFSQLENDWWWEGVVAVPIFEGARLESLKVYPLDLGASKPLGDRGMPRLARGELAGAILRRFAEISARFQPGGPVLRLEAGVEVLDVPITRR